MNPAKTKSHCNWYIFVRVVCVKGCVLCLRSLYQLNRFASILIHAIHFQRFVTQYLATTVRKVCFDRMKYSKAIAEIG